MHLTGEGRTAVFFSPYVSLSEKVIRENIMKTFVRLSVFGKKYKFIHTLKEFWEIHTLLRDEKVDAFRVTVRIEEVQRSFWTL